MTFHTTLPRDEALPVKVMFAAGKHLGKLEIEVYSVTDAAGQQVRTTPEEREQLGEEAVKQLGYIST